MVLRSIAKMTMPGSVRPALPARSTLASREAAATALRSRSMIGAIKAAIRSGGTGSALCTARDSTPAPAAAEHDDQAGRHDEERGPGGDRDPRIDLQRRAG